MNQSEAVYKVGVIKSAIKRI